MRMRSLVAAAWMIALAIVLGSSPARAGILVVGSATSIGGGSFEPSSWEGTPLEFLYCLDIHDVISTPGTFGNTEATTTGEVMMMRSNNTVQAALVGWDAPFNATIAGKIAWLLDTYGVGGRPETPEMIGLQEAIWQVIYGTGYGIPGPAAEAFRDEYLNALVGNTGDVGDYLWFSPHANDPGTTVDVHQALVGRLSVPEPTSVVLLGVFLLAGVLGFGAKRLA